MNLAEIKTGDVLLVSSKSWLARQIQKFQKKVSPEGGKWNHAAIFHRLYDELCVIEADKPGVVITPFKDYIESNRELLILKPKWYIDGSELGKFMLPYCGKTRYGKFNLIIAQSVRILTLGRIWLGPSKEQKKYFICGEWVAYCLNSTNSVIFPEWNRVAPCDIYDHPSFEHIYFVK